MKRVTFLALAAATFACAAACTPQERPDNPTDETIFTVTFDADGGTPAPAAQKVNKGETATAPPAMTRAGYAFLFWSANGSTAYNFSAPVTADITLTAEWQPEEGGNTNPTTDAGVNIGGVVWATRNVDKPGTFALRPESSGMLYQWGKKIGWSAADPMMNSNGETAWDTASASKSHDSWPDSDNPCPDGWRLPTKEELRALWSQTFVWTTQNGVSGALVGTAPNTIFLPASGERDGRDGSLDYTGANTKMGIYWTGTVTTVDSQLRGPECRSFSQSNKSSGSNGYSWTNAYSIRPVRGHQ